VDSYKEHGICLTSTHKNPVTSDQAILDKICSCPGCKRRSDKDTSHAYAFEVSTRYTGGIGRIVFVPHGTNGYYTIDQVSAVEQELARIGIDLLPLGPAHL
jgi:hypothetical protein